MLDKNGSLASVKPKLASQWHPTRNGKLKPSNFAANSTETVWWRCDKGHEFQNKISLRNNGTGCPICRKINASRTARLGRLIEGKDLATLYKELANEWDFEKNDDSPTLYMPGSKEEVWWICGICKKSYQEKVFRRVSGKGCPGCNTIKRTSR